MSEKISVQITATDGASRVFTQVASGAQKMGQSLDQAGDASKGVGKNFDEAGRSAQNLSQTLGDAYKVGQELGRSLIALGAIGTVAGASYRDQQVALANLTRTYGDSADELKTFADQLQSTTNFSNDEVLNALNNAGTLVRNYGFTVAEVQQVIAMSADLAAANGLSLADASGRVVAALRGEAEGAEVLGLTLNQQAIDRNNLTLTMSNEEAAHFRLAAAAEQSGFAVGAAAEQADSAYGSFTELKDTIQDNLQAFGGMLGPLGEMGAFLADNALQVGALSLAFVQLGKTASAIKTLITDMGGVTAAAKGLATAIGPGGGIALAVIAAEGVFLGLKEVLAHDFTDGVAEASASIDELIGQLIALNQTAGLTASQQGLAQAIKQASDLRYENADLLDAESKAYGELTDAQKLYYDVNKDGKTTLDEYTLAEKEVTQTLLDQQEALQTLNAIQPQLDEAVSARGDGAAAYQDAMADLTREIVAGTISQDAAVQAAHQNSEAYRDQALATQEAADGWVNMGDAMVYVGASNPDMADVASGVDDANQSVKEYLDTLRQTPEAFGTNLSAAAGLVSSLGVLTAARDKDTQSVKDYLAALRETPAAAGEAAANAAGVAGTLGNLKPAPIVAPTVGVSEYLASLQDVSHSGREFTSAGAGVVATFGNIDVAAAAAVDNTQAIADATEAMTKQFQAVQTSVTGTSQALDSGFRVAVSNTKALADASQGVADWAEELIGAAGAVARIDELLKENGALTTAATLSQEDYTAAQEAYNDIARENAEIQQDIAVIQAQQAPIVAGLMEQQENYLQSLAESSPEQQRFALAMMDSATSAQALNLATQLLGENGDVFTPMVEAAANLDPYLAAILEQMGLIEQQPDGTWTVTLDDQASSPIADLAAQMADLNETVAVLITYLDDDEANNGITELKAQMADLDDTTAFPQVSLIDGATSGLQNIAGLLASLDGQVATTYVQTVNQTIQQTLNPFGNGGVAGYASGGVVAKMAEWGPELLHFPNGGVALARNPGIYSVPQGTYVDTAPATAEKLGGMGRPFIGELHVHTNGTNARQMAEDVARELVPAFAQMLRQHDASLGWAP